MSSTIGGIMAHERENLQDHMAELYSTIRNECAGKEYDIPVTITLPVRSWETVMIALEIAGEL
jgi:hypothetical protein